MSVSTTSKPDQLPRSSNQRIGTIARVLCVAAASAMAVSACSSGGGPVADPETSTASESPGNGSASSGTDQEVTVATIPKDLPEVMDGQIGEVEIIGAPLPPLQAGLSIDADPARGQMAPVVIGTSFSGDEMRIDPVRSGRPTLIYFFAHWCPVCNAEIPILNELRDANAFRPDLDIVAISTDPYANRANFPPSEWITKVDWTYPAMPDGIADGGKGYLAAQSFGLDGYPMAVLINADGTVAARFGPTKDGAQIISIIDTHLAY